MVNPVPLEKPDLNDWKVESLRLTCFPSSIPQLSGTNYWQDLLDEQPENRVLRMKEGIQEDQGHLENSKLVLGIQPNRIDWLVVPGEAQDRFWIGQFMDSLNPFLGLMSRWFTICPPIKRIAFGTVIMYQVRNRESGYSLISKYLPHVELDAEGSSDFLYQINRPRASRTGIQDLLINRLSKWSVSKMGIVQIEIVPSLPQSIFRPTSESFACHLELDINTAQDYQNELPRERLNDIFQELVEFGKEIAIEGDIP
jgi:hypothetical protein